MEVPRRPTLHIALEIDGMTTVHCVRAVFQALAGVDGIRRADVALGRAEIECDRDVPDARIQAALDVVGYRLTTRRTARRVLPMHDAP
ncbi:MAG: copper chaperone [Gemmatimonadaceae bacterium]|nr:copper chaperone [Gemmatimonadaceae bacterium]